MLSGLLLEYQPFRHNSSQREEVILFPDDSGERVELKTRFDYKSRKVEQSINSKFHQLPDRFFQSPSILPWGERSYLLALQSLSDQMGLSPYQCAALYGITNLRESVQGWWFHPLLGFSKRGRDKLSDVKVK